jgi:hypothetical protein
MQLKDEYPVTNWNETTTWYEKELAERTADHTLSMGIFCSPISQEGDNRITLSRAFMTASLIIGGILVLLSCAISTVVSNTERIWNVLSLLSALGFICQLPVFFILDSSKCTADFTCSLSSGSYGLFVSMTCYLILVLITQWFGMPDWREEYEIWKLRSGNCKGGEIRDVEMGLVKEMDHVQRGKATDRDVQRDVAQINAVEDIPPPPPSPQVKVTPPSDKNKRLHKTDVSNFVGIYINTTPEKGPTEVRNISPITMFTLSKDHSIEQVQHNTTVSHEALNNSMELINRQLQKTMERKRNLKERQQQQQVIDDISQLSFLDYKTVDVDNGTFPQAPFGKDSFDPVFYADMPDLSSIILSQDEEDERLNSVDRVDTMNEAPVKAKVMDDGSVARSARSASTRSTLGLSAKQSMKSIFRMTGKENVPKNRGRKDNKEMIQEQWMLEETSLGRSNSDDLLFLVERNREDGASMTSRRSKVTVLSWASRCKSPEKRRNRPEAVAVISPTPPQIHRVVGPGNYQMPSEMTAESKALHGSAVVSPEKDDPGVEMYPSDASMSTLSLPTASDYYTSEDDRRSKRDGNSYTRGFSSGTDSETEEMSIIIAGVQRMNRKTCGKPSHLSKRRRRRKKSSRSGGSISEYSSHSGSLLDEVIDEEGELNESGEPIPAVIDASPAPLKKKSKSPRKHSKSPKKKTKRSSDGLCLSDAEHSGYESGYAYRSDFSENESIVSEYRMLSENEESTSSRAARARRNRLLSKRQIHIDPDSIPAYSEPVREAVDASGYKSPTNSYYSGKSSRDGSKKSEQSKQSRRQPYNDTIPLMSKNANMEGCFGSTSQRGNISWQARSSRMSRLRMQRQGSDTIVREPNAVASCASDEGSI